MWPERWVVATMLRAQLLMVMRPHRRLRVFVVAEEAVLFANSTTARRSHFNWYYFTKLCIVLGKRYVRFKKYGGSVEIINENTLKERLGLVPNDSSSELWPSVGARDSDTRLLFLRDCFTLNGSDQELMRDSRALKVAMMSHYVAVITLSYVRGNTSDTCSSIKSNEVIYLPLSKYFCHQDATYDRRRGLVQ